MKRKLSLNLFNAEFVGKLDFHVFKACGLSQSKTLKQRHFGKNHG